MNIGIDLGGSHIAVGIINEHGEILYKLEKDIAKENIEEIEEIIINLCKNCLEENNIDISKIQTIGMACPGEPENGCMKNVVNLGVKSYPIVENLQKRLGFRNISIRNDAKCAGIAEKKYGSLKDFDDCVFLCIGTGIGGAAFLNGKMLIPKKNSGFEFGHMIIEKNGKQCNCGNKGCFETYASMKCFKKEILEYINEDNWSSREILNYLEKNINDKNLQIIIENYLDNLVLGLSNITNILEPEVIALGGGFVYYKNILWEMLNNKYKNTEYVYNKEKRTKLTLARFGNDAGIIGASIDRM